jgi:CDP-glycerol glycerophosphotransferase (TagB/SpsB family)
MLPYDEYVERGGIRGRQLHQDRGAREHDRVASAYRRALLSPRTMRKALQSRLVTIGRRLTQALDHALPKNPRLWVFVTSRADQWGSSQQALYEHARSVGEVTAKFVYLRSVWPRTLSELRDLVQLLRAKVVVVHHGPSDFRWLCHPTPRARRVVYNVWHGVNLKAIGVQAAADEAERKRFLDAAAYYTETVASSESNRASLVAGLGVPSDRVAVTGLPRNDWLDESRPLPTNLAQQERCLVDVLGGRKLVLYAPTFRGQSGSGVYPFDDAQASIVTQLLTDAGYVLGIRAHINARGYVVPPWAIDLSSAAFPETQVLLRHTQVLITDYSGIWVDFLLLRRPMLLFTHDRNEYDGERGLIYDLRDVFPGPIADDFEQFVSELGGIVTGKRQLDEARLAHAMSTFHAYPDFAATPRCYARLRHLAQERG